MFIIFIFWVGHAILARELVSIDESGLSFARVWYITKNVLGNLTCVHTSMYWYYIFKIPGHVWTLPFTTKMRDTLPIINKFQNWFFVVCEVCIVAACV